MIRMIALIAVLLPASLTSGTYSIVARHAETGEMGVAVQSHWFDVGSVVPWAEAGVGAVATQSLVEVSYGPLGLDLMRGGLTAPSALAALVSADEGAAVRQVAMIDAAGRAVSFTGQRCIPHASGVTHEGETWSVAAQANMMHEPGVADAMLGAFLKAEGDLGPRLLAAMNAAQAAGGDIRGKQSASLLIVQGDKGDRWRARRVDLRVADSAAPLAELNRLYTTHLAYDAMNDGDRLLGAGEIGPALQRYRDAQSMNPDNVEMAFWTGVALASEGRIDESIPFFRRVLADRSNNAAPADGGADWAELLRRLPEAGLFPKDEQLINRILEAAAPEAVSDRSAP